MIDGDYCFKVWVEATYLFSMTRLHWSLGAGLNTTSQVLLSFTSHCCLISVLTFLTWMGRQSISETSSHSSLTRVSNPVTSHVSSFEEVGTKTWKMCENMLCCSAYGLWFGYYGLIIHNTTSYYVLIMSINHNNIVLCFCKFCVSYWQLNCQGRQLIIVKINL